MQLAEINLGPFVIEDTGSFLALVIGFVLLALILVKFNVPYLSLPYWNDLLHSRTERIATNHATVERELAAAQKLRDDYADRLRAIEIEHRERLEAAVREADAARGEIIAEAQASAAALKRRAEDEMARVQTRSRIQMRRDIVRISIDAAESAVREHSGPETQRRLIDQFVGIVAAAPNREASPAAGASAYAAPQPAEGA